MELQCLSLMMCYFQLWFNNIGTRILNQEQCLGKTSLKGQCHEMVVEVGPWSGRLGNIRIYLNEWKMALYTTTPLWATTRLRQTWPEARGGKEKGDAGCGSVGFEESGVIIFAKQLLWPECKFLEWADSKGSRMCQKTTTLEFIGVLLPFIMIPELLINKYVVVRVDNLACYFGWINRQAAGDATASIFIRALHLISLLLGCEVHIKHLPRLLNWEAQLVDRISRKSTTTKYDEALLRSFDFDMIPDCLKEWLKCPSDDWDINLSLLMFVKNKLIKN
jgi:hypothetical protein